MLDPFDPILLLAFAVIVGIVGFVIGRVSTAPAEPLPAPVDLSDAARAHITHEAIRAYQRSLGVIRIKAWNNLSPAERELLTGRMLKFRDGDIFFLEQGSVPDRLYQAVASL